MYFVKIGTSALKMFKEGNDLMKRFESPCFKSITQMSLGQVHTLQTMENTHHR